MAPGRWTLRKSQKLVAKRIEICECNQSRLVSYKYQPESKAAIESFLASDESFGVIGPWSSKM